MMQLLKTGFINSVPMSVPASYIGFYEHLDMAAKVGGLTVIVLQGIYTAICIWKKWKGGKDNDE